MQDNYGYKHTQSMYYLLLARCSVSLGGPTVYLSEILVARFHFDPTIRYMVVPVTVKPKNVKCK